MKQTDTIESALEGLKIAKSDFEAVATEVEGAKKISMTLAYNTAQRWGKVMKSIRESASLSNKHAEGWGSPVVLPEVDEAGQLILQKADVAAREEHEMNTNSKAIGHIPYAFHSKIKSSGVLARFAYARGLKNAGMSYKPGEIDLATDPYCRYLPLFYYTGNRFAIGKPFWWLYRSTPGNVGTETGAWAVQ